MEKLQSLPFEVGQCVESKTFQKGFRGAWFRGKIKKFTHKGVSLEYYDFSDEILSVYILTPDPPLSRTTLVGIGDHCNVQWYGYKEHVLFQGDYKISSAYFQLYLCGVSMLKLHQKVPKSNKAKEELMLRPHFPPVYSDGEVPDASTLSDVIVVKNGSWKVGDLVDWWCDNAYWSGKITQILGDDKIEIQSPSPPFGEGLSYEASRGGLRPSLEWSLKDGWKVPVPRGVANYSPCARLIHPSKQGEPGTKGEEDAENPDEHTPPSSDGLQSKGKASENQTSAICEEAASEESPSKRVRLSKTTPLNSTNHDSIESLLIDMEELINKVKWIKRILDPPDPHQPKSSWEFSEHPPSKETT